MAVARKVFTEAMVRGVLKIHSVVDGQQAADGCMCGWDGASFEDHFIDQLHKRWHETIGRRTTTVSSQ